MTERISNGSSRIGSVGASFNRSNDNGWGHNVPANELNKIKTDIAKLFQMVLELQRKVERMAKR